MVGWTIQFLEEGTNRAHFVQRFLKRSHSPKFNNSAIVETLDLQKFGRTTSQNICTMGLMDPSEDDEQREKKPRFAQEFVYIFIFLAAAAIYGLLEWLVF